MRPMLGITGYSGSGKTTLLENLLPYLAQHGLRVAVIKHSHHQLQTDKPGKDSYRMTQSGARQVIVCNDDRWALLTETSTPSTLDYLAAQFDDALVDLILVEGFKHEPINKILLHRQAMPKPLPALDQYVVAVATDYAPVTEKVRLDLNNIAEIGQFILAWYQQQ